MEITEKLLIELQNPLKVGSRRGVHLNAIPARSRYKFDLTRLSHIDKNLPKKFINSLLTEQPLKFRQHLTVTHIVKLLKANAPAKFCQGVYLSQRLAE